MEKQVYKRRKLAEKEEQLLKVIGREYELFKYKMLSRSSHEIYDSCNAIRFYECMYEYFLYNEGMEPKYRDKVAVKDGLLEELYAFYLAHEYVSVETWPDIEELLRCYVTREQ